MTSRPKYTMNFLSFCPHSEETIYKILECSSLKRIIFPSKLPALESGERRDVFSIEDIRENSLLSEHPQTNTTNISLFSESGVQFSIRVTQETALMASSIVIKFPDNKEFLKTLNIGTLKSLFFEIVPILKPHCASLYDSSKPGRRHLPSGNLMFYRDKVSRRDYLLEIQWITYFGLEMINFLGVERFKDLKSCFLKQQLFEGILVLLQEEAFEEDNPEHRMRREQAEKELGFLELLSDQ